MSDFVGSGGGTREEDVDVDSEGDDAADAEYVFMKEYRDKRIQGMPEK